MLSWHVQRILPWMRRVLGDWPNIEWVKIVNPPGGAEPFPGVRKVVRFWHDDVQAQYIAGGREGGRRWVREFLLPRTSTLDYWGNAVFETANEPVVHSPEQLRNLREYSLGAMEEAGRFDLRLCILNLAEGNPPADAGLVGDAARLSERWKLEQLAEAVEFAAQNGHYVGLHAYWLPTRGIGPLDRWHALGRVEWTLGQWLDMGVPRTVRIFIGECGVDGGIEGYAPQRGWRSQGGGLETYLSNLAVFEGALRSLAPYVAGAFLFDFGAEHPWGDYDHSESEALAIGERLRAMGNTGGTNPFGPDPDVHYWHSSRNGRAITHIILHGTEGPAGAALSWFSSLENPYKSSTHVLVRRDGRAVRVVPDRYAAHHAGYGRVPGVDGNPNLFTLGLELECEPAPVPPGYTEAQLSTAVEVVRDWGKQYGIGRDRVYLHREIDPARRTDPREFDKKAFLEQVWPSRHLPSMDLATLSAFRSRDVGLVADKVCWWLEEAVREVEAVHLARSLEILWDLIRLLGEIRKK